MLKQHRHYAGETFNDQKLVRTSAELFKLPNR
jgi:hypothetical protein